MEERDDNAGLSRPPREDRQYLRGRSKTFTILSRKKQNTRKRYTLKVALHAQDHDVADIMIVLSILTMNNSFLKMLALRIMISSKHKTSD
jgi:DNA-directed RNA polymerase